MNAVAITGNLTVTGQTSGGYATLALTTVTPTSALNFPSGDTRANNVTMPLSPTGRLQARVSADRAHLILDVTGYSLAGTVAATYTPLGTGAGHGQPHRELGSESPAGSSRGSPRTITVAGANGIPADALAVTAQPHRGRPVGRRLSRGHPERDRHAEHVDPELPEGRHAGNGLTAPLDAGGKLGDRVQRPERGAART